MGGNWRDVLSMHTHTPKKLHKQVVANTVTSRDDRLKISTSIVVSRDQTLVVCKTMDHKCQMRQQEYSECVEIGHAESD